MKKRIFLSFFGLAMVSLALVSTVAFAANKQEQSRGPQGKEMGSGAQQNGNPGIVGTVSSVNGSQITIITKQRSSSTPDVVYTIDASLTTIKRVGNKALSTQENKGKPEETVVSISDVQNGEMLLVKGVIQGTTVAAKEISIIGQGRIMNQNGVGTSSTFTVRGERARDHFSTSTDNGTSTREVSEGKGFWSKIVNPFKNFFKKIF